MHPTSLVFAQMMAYLPRPTLQRTWWPEVVLENWTGAQVCPILYF